MSTFLDLPDELILVCLLSPILPFSSTQTCRLICTRINRLIAESIDFKYLYALHLHGMLENPRARLPPTPVDRLGWLTEREANWIMFRSFSTRKIKLDFKPSTLPELAGGMFIVGSEVDAQGIFTALRYTPTAPAYGAQTEPPQWGTIKSVDDRPLLGFGVALEEFGLVALVSYIQNLDDPTTISLYIQLSLLTSGGPHPAAAQSSLFVHRVSIRTRPPKPHVEICGRRLALALAYPTGTEHPSRLDDLYVWDWMSGQRVPLGIPLQLSTEGRGLAFISPDIILLPNSDARTLDLLFLQPNGDDNSARLVKLHLPPLRDDLYVTFFRCRASPPLRGSANFDLGSESTTSPFVADPAAGLLFLLLEVETTPEAPYQYFLLLDRPTFLKRLRALGLTSAASEHPDGIPWAQWGPHCSRWLRAENLSAYAIAVSHGPRLVSIHRDAALPDQNGSPIRIIDFCPSRVREALAEGNRGCSTAHVRPVLPEVVFSETGDPVDVDGAELDWHVQPPKGPFTERIVSALPYMEIFSDAHFRYDAVEMDNECVIGTQVVEERVTEMEVMWFGFNRPCSMDGNRRSCSRSTETGPDTCERRGAAPEKSFVTSLPSRRRCGKRPRYKRDD
uniref:F-box domain-containing protein n=1 Tax=Mycena chlorophos TaxID=658473 RepID=A0ABQ0M102_MYCCL|nr:predicted protein [Mycena chlorophos]